MLLLPQGTPINWVSALGEVESQYKYTLSGDFSVKQQHRPQQDQMLPALGPLGIQQGFLTCDTSLIFSSD